MPVSCHRDPGVDLRVGERLPGRFLSAARVAGIDPITWRGQGNARRAGVHDGLWGSGGIQLQAPDLSRVAGLLQEDGADRALPVGPRRRPRPLRDHAQGGALRARSGSRQAERRDGDPTVGVDRSRAGDDARHQRRQRDVLSGALPAAVRVRRVRPQVRLRGRRRRAPRLRGRPARCGRRGHWRSLDGARCRGDTAARRPSGASPEHRGTASTPRDRSHDGRTLTPHASSNHARLLPRRPPRSLTPARDGAYPRARFRLRGVEMPLRFAPPRWPKP